MPTDSSLIGGKSTSDAELKTVMRYTIRHNTHGKCLIGFSVFFLPLFHCGYLPHLVKLIYRQRMLETRFSLFFFCCCVNMLFFIAKRKGPTQNIEDNLFVRQWYNIFHMSVSVFYLSVEHRYCISISI